MYPQYLHYIPTRDICCGTPEIENLSYGHFFKKIQKLFEILFRETYYLCDCKDRDADDIDHSASASSPWIQ